MTDVVLSAGDRAVLDAARAYRAAAEAVHRVATGEDAAVLRLERAAELRLLAAALEIGEGG